MLDALSVAVWMLGRVAAGAGRMLQRLAQDRLPRRVALERRAGGRPWRRRAVTLAAPVLVVVSLVLALNQPVLELAALPVSSSVGPTRLPPLAQPSRILAADGSTLAVVHDGINRRVIPLADVPDVVRQAVVAAEDKDFWRHGGYDGKAIARALWADLRAGQVTQGGSTITQQLAKENFVGGAQTLVRKAKELLYAVALEKRLTKDQLLERYLNEVYFGSQAYGIEAAAEEFFGVHARELSLDQAALLAGLIRAPAALDPRTDPDSARVRRNEVLDAMARLGFVDPGAAAEARAKPVGVLPARPPEILSPYAVEAVKREFLANPAFGKTDAARRQALMTGGFEIRTTIDPRLQSAAETALSYVSDDLGSALVAVDPRSGAVVALADGGQAGSTDFDVATQGRRSPGSTFKPLAAVAALEAGMPQNQYLVGDGPIQLTYGGAPEPWAVDNYGGEKYGPLVLHDAVVNSVNTAFAQIGVAVGPERIADVARRLGIDVDQAMGPPDARGPAVALGGLTHGVSPLEMASAYGTFAAGGARTTPHLIAQVIGPDGKERYRARPAPQPVIDPAVNGILVDILKDAVAEGTGSAAALPAWQPLGKTGTSDEGADAWFVGAVPVLSAAVWVGHPGGVDAVPGLTGGSVAAPVWRAFMTSALRGTTPVTFPPRTADRPVLHPLDLPTPFPCTTPCAAKAAA
jgi:penicillin-binding protein 1A